MELPPIPPIELPENEDVYTVVDTIYSGSSTCITRASHGGKTYIVKSNIKSVQHQKKLRKFFKEFSIGSSIHSPYVVHYHDFKRLGYGFAIITDDIGGVPLKSLIPRAQGLPIDQFLEISIKIVQGLGAVHAAGVIHRDINPTNIVVNTQTHALNIIDFGMSTQIIRNEVTPMASPVVLQGTFLYMSPEQTGRMNRVVDYRSDYYSLGITFYEMLAGEPPFGPSVDPLDLIYKHVAVYPRNLLSVRPEVGEALSDVVVKLMSKNAEDRYQDCRGLLADLRAIQRSRHDHVPLVDFIPGLRDQTHELHVSQKLYGRSYQVKVLTQCFAQICSGNSPFSLVLVKGYSGVGKTVLVHEVHKPLSRQKGYYVSGKYEQFMSANPFSALIKAIRQLVKQVLTESEEKLEKWKARLKSGVGTYGQLIVDIIPEIELIIGTQPPVAPVGAVESLHRFKEVLCSFLFSLSSEEHPLVIFLDDLQWADSNTLSLLGALFNSDKTIPHYLLIIGAYRDNEVGPDHLLTFTLQEIERKGGQIESLLLPPLSEGQVIQLLDDTFNSSSIAQHKVDTSLLAHLVHVKTQGSPFFVNQLLTALYKNGHISPIASTFDNIEDEDGGGWQCNMEAINAANYTSNVVDLMVSSLRTLPGTVQKLIGIGAIIGSQFDLVLLSRVHGIPEQQASYALRAAVRGGFVIPSTDEALDGPSLDSIGSTREMKLLNNTNTKSPRNSSSLSFSPSGVRANYRFPHDRVQQAAISLLDKEEIHNNHIKISEQLLLICAEANKELSYNLLAIVNHLNMGFAEEQPPYILTPEHSKESLPPSSSILPPITPIDLSPNSSQVAPFVSHPDIHIASPSPAAPDTSKANIVEAIPISSLASDNFSDTLSYLPFSLYNVASLNYEAAVKAKGTNAYLQGIEYANSGIKLLEVDIERSWKDQHTLCMNLYKMKTELHTRLGDFSCPPCYELLERAQGELEKTEVYVLLHDRHEAESNLPAALDIVFESLALLGIDLPTTESDQKNVFLAQISVLNAKLSTLSKLDNLVNLPVCNDPIQNCVFKLLSNVWLAAYMLGKLYLAGLVCLLTIVRSVDHGLSPYTGKSIVIYTLHSLLFSNDYYFLNDLAKAGLKMLDTRYPQHKALRGPAYLMYGLGIATWVYPLAECYQYIEAAFQLNKQSGNFLWMTYGCHYHFEYYIMCGQSLQGAARQYEKYLPFWKEEGMKFGMYNFMEIAAQPIWTLTGIDKNTLVGDDNEDSIFSKIPLYKGAFNSFKMYCSFFMNDRKDIIKFTDIAAEIIPICFMGLYRLADTETIASLVYLDWISRNPLAYELYGNPNKRPRGHPSPIEDPDVDMDGEADLDRKAKIERIQKRLENVGKFLAHITEVSQFCEANFYHKIMLIRAELARVAIQFNSTAIYSAVKLNPSKNAFLNSDSESDTDYSRETRKSNNKRHRKQDFEDTLLMYESAIESARKHGFQQYEAKGLELYANFWLTTPKKPKERFALMYLKEALIVCERWGATAKASILVEKCNKLSPHVPIRKSAHAKRLQKKTNLALSSLDLDLIVQVSQTISSEVDFDSLVIKMVKVIVEHANAQRGSFFIVDEDPDLKVNLWVTAEYSYQKVPKDASEKDEPRSKGITLLKPYLPFTEWKDGPLSVVNYVRRMLQPVVLNCAHNDSQFGTDEYIVENQVKSIICMPILLKNTLMGVIYLENNLCDGLYNKTHVELLKVLTSQMAIAIENNRFLHNQIEKQSEKMRFDQLKREEQVQRERADAAEKYKLQLENFIDMICHEIRNPLNGIFGNTDLTFYYLEAIDEIFQKHKLVEMELSQQQQQQPLLLSPATPTVPPHLPIPPNSPRLIRSSSLTELKESLSSVEEARKVIGTETKEAVGKTAETLMKYILEQLMVSANSIQKCAEHQKCMTDDVLQLSRLRSHKLTISNTFYRPWETMMTTMTIFKPQAEGKGLYLRLNAVGGSYENTELYGDAVRIYQILSNLLSNALKFTHNGGVTLTFSIVPDEFYEKSSGIPSISPRSQPFTPLSSPSSVGTISPVFPSPGSSSPISPTITFPGITGSETPQNESSSRVASPTRSGDSSPELALRETIPCKLSIVVEDTGIGMSQEEQARIFKRFSQANNRTSHEYGGSGLGLAISRKLAKLMHGTISVKSEKGKGSSFSIVIPCKKAIPISSPAIPLSTSSSYSSSSSSSSSLSSSLSSSSLVTSPSLPTSHHGGLTVSLPSAVLSETVSSISSSVAAPFVSNLLPSESSATSTMSNGDNKEEPAQILIVEDNIVNQSVLTRVLKIKGFTVDVANNGAQGFEKYQSKVISGKRYDFVLMDLQMPVMDGLTSTELIRNFETENNLPPVTIIGLSGNARDEYRHTALAAGMNECIF